MNRNPIHFNKDFTVSTKVKKIVCSNYEIQFSNQVISEKSHFNSSQESTQADEKLWNSLTSRLVMEELRLESNSSWQAHKGFQLWQKRHLQKDCRDSEKFLFKNKLHCYAKKVSCAKITYDPSLYSYYCDSTFEHVDSISNIRSHQKYLTVNYKLQGFFLKNSYFSSNFLQGSKIKIK